MLAVGLGQLLHAQPFQHPGILHTQADFDRMAQMVNTGQQPYLDGWNQLTSNPYSQAGWNPRPLSVVIRGGTGDNVAQLYIDVQRAYQNALRWKVSGSTAHGDIARNILNAWSLNLTAVTGNADRYLAAGMFGYQLANTAEMMRGYPGFEVGRMQDMLWNVFYKPLNERFLYGNEFGADHNDACIENYWANWDLCNMASAAAISIFCDRRNTYEKAVNYFKFGAGNGALYHAVPYLHPDGLGQWQESGRDQGHTILGIGTTYYYVVAPANANGEGAASNQAGVTTISAAPTSVMALAGNNQVTLLWRSPFGAASYMIKRSPTNGGPYTAVASGVTASSYTDASAGNGTNYYYVVAAVNSGGETNSSQVAATPNPSGLVHHWKFDATSGTSAANSVSSPNGELSAGATWAAGRFNNAVSLNGSVGHVSFPNGLVSTLNDCTIAGWFRLNSVSTWTRIFDFGSGTVRPMTSTN